MTERDAAEAIFQKLCEQFKLDGREGENAFTLGGELGFTEDEVRNVLWIFRTDSQRCVEIRRYQNRAGEVNKTWNAALQVSLSRYRP